MGISKTITNFLRKAPSGNSAAESDQKPALRIVIAGGGTGGHLFPGLAIAEAFMQQAPKTRVMFVTSGKKIEETVLAGTPYEKKLISVEGIKGKHIFSKLGAMTRLPKGLTDSIKLLLEFKADVVIGMGAYSAGPVIAAAWLLRVHRVICEQNSIPGLTNRLLSGLAERIYVSFPDTGFKSSCKEKISFTGNPVRSEILASAGKSADGDLMQEAPERLFNVLILGGSQGAHSINMAAIDSVVYLQDPGKYRFVHQTGIRDEDEVRKVYQQMKIAADVAPFFGNMADRYREADLVICRSGATTVAELTVAGKAAVLIPFPYATEDHQMLNARALAEKGAAEMIQEKDLNGNILAKRIEYYSERPEVTGRMKQKIRELSHPDAARRIAEDIYRLINTGGRKSA